MKTQLDKRNPYFIKALKTILWPVLKYGFQLKVTGLELLPAEGPVLFVSNHNSGALLESHSSLFVLQNGLGKKSLIYGLTHPSLFKIPLMKQYFELIGGVPATYEMADIVLKNGQSLIIFPGGNRQALRSIWHYRDNHFRWSHGWAKIAMDHKVSVIPISFKGSHFANPIFVSNQWISKILILPWFLGIKWAPISLGQILCSLIMFSFLKILEAPIVLNIVLTYLTFILSTLVIVFPYPIKMTIYPALIPETFTNQEELEESVAKIMDSLY